MSRNNDYKIGDLFYFLHHQNYYKIIGHLSRQTNTTFLSQKVNKGLFELFFRLIKHSRMLNIELIK